MAIQRVSVRMCDVHLQRGEEVEGSATPLKLDLCDEHMDLSVRDALTFLNGGPTKRIPRQRKKAAGPKEPTASEVRAWCRENDIPVSDTGKVGKESVAAYREAHSLS